MTLASVAEADLPVLLGMGEIKEVFPPIGIGRRGWLAGPGPMEAEDARIEAVRSCGGAAAAPALQTMGRAGAAEEPLDATARDQRPTTGADHGADHLFIHAAVADQAPVDLQLDDAQPIGGKG